MTRLKWSIQALAAPAFEQIRLFPRFVCVADELAIDVEEALRGIRSVGRPRAAGLSSWEAVQQHSALAGAARPHCAS
ncbi:hypothetical protein [Sorangium sp. So ce1335]|uniref:hypothetical protein n=1 Tax=Sorangium sp. So ce1335 TaxID=3133335 RepID=UPI003F5FE36E